jgi:hypothetical protein
VRSAEVAVELATDIVPIVGGTEPRVHRGYERRRQNVQRSEIGLHVEADEVTRVEEPVLGSIGKRRFDSKELSSRNTYEGMKSDFTDPCLRLPTTNVSSDAPAKKSDGTSSCDLRTFASPAA